MNRLPDDIGVSTVAWDEWELPRALERAARYAGLVEIYSDGAHSLLSERNRAAAQTSGLTFTVHGPYDGLELGSPRDRSRRAAVAAHQRNLEAAAQVGARCYVVHPDFSMTLYRTPTSGRVRRHGRDERRRAPGRGGPAGVGEPAVCAWGWDQRVQAALQRSFAELEELQRDIGVRVAIENMPAPGHSHLHGPGDLVSREVDERVGEPEPASGARSGDKSERRPERIGGEPAPAAALAGGRRLDLGGLGFVLDAGHAAVCGTLAAFLAEPPPGFVHVHLHDNKGGEETGDPHLALGDGVVDIAGVLRAARGAGATVILELGEEERLLRSIAYLELERLLVDSGDSAADRPGEVPGRWPPGTGGWIGGASTERT